MKDRAINNLVFLIAGLGIIHLCGGMWKHDWLDALTGSFLILVAIRNKKISKT